MIKSYLILLFLTVAGIMASCQKNSDTTFNHAPYIFNLPAQISPPPIPSDNELTIEKVNLGKKLFFDPILSKDSSIACATCHKPSLGFADATAVSKGVFDSLGFRNAMPLTNVAYNNLFFWDGGVPSLELQVIAPIVSPFEMQETIENVLVKLNRHQEYKQLFFEVFESEANQENLIKAIASFERTLVSFNSKFDQYHYLGQNVLSESELRGKDLFFSERLACASCHSLPNFTNHGFANNGLYDDYKDKGRRRVTVRFQDDALFRIPTLRNVERSAPYMHDGSIATLKQVIEHYNNGGSNHFNKSDKIKPLQLTETEKNDLLAFLKTLTDINFLTQHN